MPAVAARSAPASRRSRPAAHQRPAARSVARKAPGARAASGPSRLVPVAVGRSAIAVGGVADWWLVRTLTRGRLWIGVLTTLLVGIVAINVLALSFSASSSKTAQAADQFKRENSALRTRIAGGLAADRLTSEAGVSGLIVPDPGAIRYLRPAADDAALAAKRLRDGSITVDGSVTPPVSAAATEASTPTAAGAP